MIQDFKIGVCKPFSKNIAVVDQVGFIDLRVASATGEVPSDLEGVEGQFNGIEDPKSIIGRPDDVFSAMRAQVAVATAVVATSTESPVTEGDA